MAKPKVIDAHHHYMPQELCDDVERYVAPDETVTRDDNGKYIRIFRDGVQIFTIDAVMYPSIPLQLKDMDETGVDAAVLSTAIWQEWNTMEMAPFINDRMAELQKEYPGRIIGLAHVPPFAPEAPQELERANRELGLRGACLSTHFQGRYLDAKEYAPFYRKAEELGMPIFIHAATLPLEYGSLKDYDLARSLGRCIEHSISTARLVYGGVLGEFPRLRIVMGHLGGDFFVLKSRFLAGAPGLWNMPSVPISKMLEQLYFDTAPAAWTRYELECAVGTLGVKQIVFGTDYPVVNSMLKTGMAAMQEAQISPEDKARMFGGNVAELLRLD